MVGGHRLSEAPYKLLSVAMLVLGAPGSWGETFVAFH